MKERKGPASNMYQCERRPARAMSKGESTLKAKQRPRKGVKETMVVESGDRATPTGGNNRGGDGTESSKIQGEKPSMNTIRRKRSNMDCV